MKRASQTGKSFSAIAVKVSMVSIVGNLLLSAIKLSAGIWAHSGAMISDAVHSASDLFSTIVVLIGIRLAAKEPDQEHPYGHERLECIAAILLSAVLLATAISIGTSAVGEIAVSRSTPPAIPGIPALIAATISIISKEAMFRYTRHYARMYHSPALMADAWHHRSDALSSIGAWIGIAGARHGFPALDAVSSLVICTLIVKAAYDIFMDAVSGIVDHSCDASTEYQLYRCAKSVSGVRGIDRIQSRIFASRIYVDMEISVDGSLRLYDAHEIAENVHKTIETTFPEVKHIMIHVNPDSPSD